MTEAIKITGLDEVRRSLFKLNYRLGERVTRLALQKGAKFMAKTIKNVSPVKSGRLKKSISIRNSRFKRFQTTSTIGVYILVGGGSAKAHQEAKARKAKGGESANKRLKAKERLAWYAKSVEYGYRANGRKGRGYGSGGGKMLPTGRKAGFSDSKARQIAGKGYIEMARLLSQDAATDIIIDSISRLYVEAARQAGLQAEVK